MSAVLQQDWRSWPPSLKQQYLERLRQKNEINAGREKARSRNFHDKFAGDPVGYAEKILKVKWWDRQKEIARALVNHSRVFVQSGNDTGKSFLAGGLVNWHYDCFNPGKTLTTAPTQHQVVDLTWGEVRKQRRTKPPLQPKAPRIESFTESGELDPAHYAAGYTARDANAFQGVHEEHLLIIFEEAVGIDAQFWEAADGMLSSGENNKWLAIMNPTDTSSAAYQYLEQGGWHVIVMSALDHPNLAAELRGLPKPFPKAISLATVQERIEKWCMRIEASTARATDFSWPPDDYCNETGIAPSWYRPNGLFEARVLGRWPSQSIDAVWSQAAWEACVKGSPELQAEANASPVEIGCDVARKGDDFTAIHVRRGPVSLHHESHNGWTTDRTAGRLKELAGKYGQLSGQEPTKVLIKIDDDGVGGGVTDQKGEYNFVGINAGSKPVEPERYPNRRSELWFTVAERADECRLDFSRLDSATQSELRRQFMAPKWKLDSKGRRVVEDKEQTKKRIKRSPDDADAVNLAYAAAKRAVWTAIAV